MQILTSDKWSLFKEDGKLFETLIGELLHLEYPNADFTHTSWTRDGGKDYEAGISFFDGNLKAWAECKYHKDTLPIEDVSMTLFMAYIESAHAVLFFSYSPVNSEFQKYIDLYQKKSDKTIKIYDDFALEELILKHKDEIDLTKYFGDFSTDSIAESKGVTYKYWLHNMNQNNLLHINDVVNLEFCAMNHSSKNVTLNIKIRHNKNSVCFEILNSSFNKKNLSTVITIPPNGIAGITLKLKLQEYSSKINYPSLLVTCNGEEQPLRIKSSVKCLWLAEVPLLGEHNKLFIKNVTDLLNTKYSCFGMLLGRSGTGKSRIINEISLTAVVCDYRTIIFDADSLSRLSADSFFKKLLSDIENIPDLSNITSVEIQKKYISEKDQDDYTKFAVSILFSTELNYDRIKEKMVDYIIHAISQHKYFIALDNIQFYDESILAVLERLVERYNEFNSSFILFSANADYIYEDTPSDKLTRKMEFMASKIPKQFIYKETKEFNTPEAMEYLEKCLNTDNSNKEKFIYEQTFTKIIETYGTNPLFLQNYLLYLMQEKIIEQTNYSSYYIVDIDAIKNSLIKIPNRLLALLESREEKFIRDVIITEELLQNYILFVSYLAFVRWMPLKMIQTLVDIPIEIINSMEKIGLIKKNKENEYGFYHQQIENYFNNKYPYYEMSDASLKNFCNATIRRINIKEYLECIFLAQYTLNEVNYKILSEITKKICMDNIDVQKTLDICFAVKNILENNTLDELPEKYVEIYTHMTNLLSVLLGISSSQKLYNSVYERFSRKPISFIQYLPETVGLLKTFLTNKLHLNQAEDSLKKSNNIITILNNNFKSNINLNNILSEIYEIQIFVYNELQDIEMALKISDTVMSLAQASDIPSKIIKSWYARGDIYYTNVYSNKYLREICECWNEAFKIYQTNDFENDDWYTSTALYLNVYMRRILTGMIQQDSKQVKQEMSDIVKYIGKTKMTFFEIKIRQLYVCYNIFSDIDRMEMYSKYEKMVSYLKESIDICALYGSQTMYLDCFHLLSILQKVCGKKEYSIDNYQKSYSILQSLLKKNSNSANWAHFLLDMVIAMRQLNQKDKIPPNIWKLVKPYSDIEDVLKKYAISAQRI